MPPCPPPRAIPAPQGRWILSGPPDPPGSSGRPRLRALGTRGAPEPPALAQARARRGLRSPLVSTITSPLTAADFSPAVSHPATRQALANELGALTRAQRGGHPLLTHPPTHPARSPTGPFRPRHRLCCCCKHQHTPKAVRVGPTVMCAWLELIPRQEPATDTRWGQGHSSRSGGGRVTPRHSTRQPPSSLFNYQRFPRFSSSQASACSLLGALLELLRVLLLSGNATAAQSPSLRDEQHLTLSLTPVPGWQRGRSCSATAGSWRWLRAPISIPLAALVLLVLLLSWHPKPLGTGTMTEHSDTASLGSDRTPLPYGYRIIKISSPPCPGTNGFPSSIKF